MEHTVHLGAKAFIEAINPTKKKKTAKKGTTVVEESDAEEEDEEEVEEDEDWTLDWTAMDELSEGEEIDEPIDFEPGDLLGKVLALINQVCP